MYAMILRYLHFFRSLLNRSMNARPIVVALSSIVLSYSDFISEPHESGVAFSNVSGIHRAPDKHRYFSLQMEKKNSARGEDLADISSSESGAFPASGWQQGWMMPFISI